MFSLILVMETMLSRVVSVGAIYFQRVAHVEKTFNLINFNKINKFNLVCEINGKAVWCFVFK